MKKFNARRLIVDTVIFLFLALLVALGASMVYFSKPENKSRLLEQPSAAPSVSAPAVVESASVDQSWKQKFNEPLSDEDVPEAQLLKFGEEGTYVYDLKVTVTQPDSAGNFSVTLNAPNGWVVDSTDELDRSQVTVSDGQFSCPQPFSEELVPGTVKTYNCKADSFSPENGGYIGVQAAGYMLLMWTANGLPY